MGGSSKQTIGYRYFMGLYMGECLGPVDELREIRVGDLVAWNGSETKITLPIWGLNLPIRTIPATGPITQSQTIIVHAPDLFGGDKKEGGVAGKLEVRMGEPEQMPSAYMQSQVPGPWPAARGLVTTVFDGQVSAMNPYIKLWAKKWSRWKKGWKLGVWEPDLVKVGEGMNGAHIIYQVRTEGVRVGTDVIDHASFKKAAEILAAEGFGLCLKWSRAESAGDFIGIVCNHIGAMCIEDPVSGLVTLQLIRKDYDSAALPLIDESSILQLEGWEQPLLDNSVNEVTVVYRDCNTNKDGSITYQNLANVQAQGRVVAQKMQFPGLWNAELAGRVAAREVAATSCLPCRVSLRVNRTWWGIKRGDVVALSWKRRGVARLPMRVMEVDEGTLTATDIRLTLVQDVAGMADASYIAPVESAWQEPDNSPRPVLAQRAVEASYRDLARLLRAADLAAVPAVSGFMATLGVRPSGVAFGYTLQTRLVGAAFAEVGEGDFTPSGLLIADMSPSTTSIALTAAVAIDHVTVGSAALIDEEWVRVDAIDPGAGMVTIARGCVDTVPVAHAAGARVWFADSFMGFDQTEYLMGEVVEAILLTRTMSGELDAALASPVSLTMSQRQARPYVPAGLKFNGANYPESMAGEMIVSWSHRDRLLQADQLVDSTAASIGPEPTTRYALRFFDGLHHGLLVEKLDIDGDSATVVLNHTGPVAMELFAISDNGESWQKHEHVFMYTPSPDTTESTITAGSYSPSQTVIDGGEVAP